VGSGVSCRKFYLCRHGQLPTALEKAFDGANEVSMTDKIGWYFAFRQTSPTPPGQWIACGPYDSYEQASEERRRAKNWDCEVSVPFSAASKEEAEGIAKKQ
jgi:hypothetical protein